MAKASASNVAERTPTAKKGAANVSGSNGGALAALFLKEWDAKAKQIDGEQMSMKERLSSLVLLNGEDHKAFRGAFSDRREVINSAAKGLGKSLSEYFIDQPGSQYVYVQTSEWTAMSRACEMGWKPNTSLPWATLKQQATDTVREAEARAALTVDERQTLEKVEADTKMTPEKKAELLENTGIAAKLEGIKAKLGGPGRRRATTTAPTTRTTGGTNVTTPSAADAPAPAFETADLALTKAKQIMTMLRNQSVNTIEFVVADLSKFIESAEFKARKAEAHAKFLESSRKSADAANMAKGTTVKKGAIGDEVKEEKAEARGTRRTPAKRGRKATK